jgi:poly(A) polymerase
MSRSALVESRLRHLVLKLELIESLVLAHPFTRGFDRSIVCFNERQAIDAGRGVFYTDVDDAVGTEYDVPEDVETEGRMVHTTTFYIGLAIEPRAAGISTPRRLDISWPTSEFTKICKQWEKFDETSMGICIKHIKRCVVFENHDGAYSRSTSLPADICEESDAKNKILKRGKSGKVCSDCLFLTSYLFLRLYVILKIYFDIIIRINGNSRFYMKNQAIE